MDKAIFVGDLHGNIHGLYKKVTSLSSRGTFSFVLVLGDTCLYPSIGAAEKELSSKNFKKYKTRIEEYLLKGIPEFPMPVYLLTGNNDDPQYLQSWNLRSRNLHYLPSTTVMPIGYKTDLITLNGIYANSAWSLSPEEAPYQYYTGEEIKRVKALIKNSEFRSREVILATHPGAKHYILPDKAKKEGRGEINSLASRENVVLHIHGHHHVNYVNQLRKDVPKYAVGLGNFGKNIDSFFTVSFS